jgi:two-component system, chemotaxis family, chemotaxis protein CheY
LFASRSDLRLPDNFPADLVVLVAEDDAFARALLGKMLSQIGVSNVLLAADGDEALALFRSGMAQIDLVLSDLHMPKRNGFELLEAIRALDADIPFLLVTGDARSRAVVAAREREISAYIVKPLSPAQLREKIVAALLRQPGYTKRVWRRTEEGLSFQRDASEKLRAAFDIWRLGCAGDAIPTMDMLARWGVARQAPFDRTSFVVDVVEPGPRLRYSYIGADILAKFARDPTGAHVDEQSALHRHYAMPAYARVLATRGPHFRFVKGIEGFFLIRYCRLLLPFGDDGRIEAILGCVDLL